MEQEQERKPPQANSEQKRALTGSSPEQRQLVGSEPAATASSPIRVPQRSLLETAINEFQIAIDPGREGLGAQGYPRDASATDYRPAEDPGRAPLEHHPMYAFPFDTLQPPPRAPRGAPPPVPRVPTTNELVDRMPAHLRQNPQFARILNLPDPAHEQRDPHAQPDPAKELRAREGALRESLAAMQFARERGIDPATIQRTTPAIDFEARTRGGGSLPFDPFLSPAGVDQQGRPSDPKPIDVKRWARGTGPGVQGGTGAYHEHTHGKGGNPDTVGVWDQTYSSPATVSAAEQSLRDPSLGSAGTGANVHPLRVPIAEMYAREHIAAEQELEASGAHDHYKRVKGEYVKSGGDPDKFTDALKPASQDSSRWRARLAEHPAWKKSYGS
jgi:hypothetical protein